jgi:transcription antitermination factor NusG
MCLRRGKQGKDTPMAGTTQIERLAQGHVRVCVRACVQSYVRVRMMLNVRVCPAVRRVHAGAGVVSGSDHL